jgi:hypothetical protein
MSFDGIDDYIKVSHSAILDSPSQTNKFTIVTKIKPTQVASTKAILEK